ncbi:helix-turn-helix domain-containing protein [Limnobacter sp. P1]|uniref:helix-turn-helix domain-containing protein n=1 Tax=Limnobacter olei TaxID=3031298 RepID=UPI0023B1F802|nr:helix-turn-helix transcriptional regulator [Limnobacter sp. P1]
MQKDSKLNTEIGFRLREERTRLGLTQDVLASHGGVQRLAQAQYESGAREPKAGYLHKISQAGVDLTYVLLGHSKQNLSSLSNSQRAQIEKKIFLFIEEQAREGNLLEMTAESKFIVFQLLRDQAAKNLLEDGKIPDELTIPIKLSA